MTFRDLVDLSVGNLWRVKLRAFLTIAGVVIAIATLVAMLSFAAGNHRYVTEGYQNLGLLMRMNVYPKRVADTDSTEAAELNDEAIEKLSAIPGVRLAYPFVDFEITASLPDTQTSTTARALPSGAFDSKTIQTLLDGARFSSDDAREAIVTREFLERIGATEPDAVIGKTLIVSMKATSIDSALYYAVGDPQRELRKLMSSVRIDSLYNRDYQRRLFEKELSARAGRFFDGLFNRQLTVSDTLVIKAVGADNEKYQIHLAPVLIPARTARILSSAGSGLGTDPAEMFTAMQSGVLFRPQGVSDSKTYPRVSLDLEPQYSAAAISDSVEALGFRAFSFAEQFKEIQRFFVYYYLGLGVLGLIALVTASLGIVNTMVMSITERRREIGILKSLGAEERVIKLVFLTESAAIGFIGAAIGLLLGWLGTRIVAAVAKIFMARVDMPIFDPFAMPPWLILLALAFGVLVSLLAGSYPAARAARVDPVEALRGE